MRIKLYQPMTKEYYGAIVDGVPENDCVASVIEATGLNPTDTDRILAELSGPGLLAVRTRYPSEEADSNTG